MQEHTVKCFYFVETSGISSPVAVVSFLEDFKGSSEVALIRFAFKRERLLVIFDW